MGEVTSPREVSCLWPSEPADASQGQGLSPPHREPTERNCQPKEGTEHMCLLTRQYIVPGCRHLRMVVSFRKEESDNVESHRD